jgi:hypothetical protein
VATDSDPQGQQFAPVRRVATIRNLGDDRFALRGAIALRSWFRNAQAAPLEGAGASEATRASRAISRTGPSPGCTETAQGWRRCQAFGRVKVWMP